MNATQLLDVFRSDPEKVKIWREVVELPIFKEVTAVLTASGPQNHPSTDETDSKRLGRIEGHAERANWELLLATHPKEFKPLPETYHEDN